VEAGYKSDLLLLHTGGGVMTPRGVKEFAGRLAGSGIAAGAIASRHIAALCGFPNSIGLDMGGTSCDVSLAYEGQSRVTKDWFVEFGYPIRFPSIEVLTIGAGGGSLAWIDEAGGLRNGPQSAGANPGPACYGNSNRVPTNTDANVALGRLGTKLAGGIHLDAEKAREAVRTGVAEPFKLGLEAAADAIIRVANANMADAVRLISISRGYDPRLVAFGGAGALHGADITKELSIPAVIVPPHPGITSAMGCLLVDVQHDLATSYLKPAAEADPTAIEAAFKALEYEAAKRLAHEGVAAKDVVMQRTVDMMYQGQWRSLAVPALSPTADLAPLVEAFHQHHEREYNFRRDDTPVGLFRLNLKAVGVVPKAELAKTGPSGVPAAPRSHRRVWFAETGGAETPVYWRPDLAAGATFNGPAIVEQVDSTTVVPPASQPRSMAGSTSSFVWKPHHDQDPDARSRHLRGSEEFLHHGRGPDGRADPQDLLFLRDLQPRLLERTSRRQRRQRRSRQRRYLGPRRHTALHMQGGDRVLQRRHASRRRLHDQRPSRRRHAFQQRPAHPAHFRGRRGDRLRAVEWPLVGHGRIGARLL
jgi:N-methylhydantoinase A